MEYEMHQDFAMTILLLALLALGMGLFLYNLRMAFAGLSQSHKIKEQRAACDREAASMQVLTERTTLLRAQVRNVFGENLSAVFQPIDDLSSQAISALLAGDSARALQLLEQSCRQMQALLDARPV